MSNASALAILVLLGINVTLGSEAEARDFAQAIGSGNPAHLDRFIIENQDSAFLADAIHLSTQNRVFCDGPALDTQTKRQAGTLGYGACGDAPTG